MGQRIQVGFFAVTLAVAAVAMADAASAACTRLAFSVNDYGKVGPANDAKNLLDTYIAKKMTERGVTSYKTGKKTVNCELFLDVILFDEYTCKAEATVCWDGSTLPKSEQVTATPAADKAPSASKTTTGSIDKSSSESAPEKAPEPIAAPKAAATPVEPPDVAADAAAVPPLQAEPNARVEVYEKVTAPPADTPAVAPAANTVADDVVVAPSPVQTDKP